MRVNRLVVLSAVSLFVFAGVIYGGANDVFDYYFYDGTFIAGNVCGTVEKECDNTFTETGVRSDWRARITTDCITSEQTYVCQHYTGTGWEAVDCSMSHDEAGRIRIPVGQQ